MKLHGHQDDKHAVHSFLRQEDAMLVLARKKGESFIIEKDGDRIEVHVLKKNGSKVSIGVKASLQHKIVRDNAKKVH